MAFWRRLRLTLEMIKFEHSVFALPFALTGALLAFREHLSWAAFGYKLLWIVMAMVGARSAAMTFNRILDADIDSAILGRGCATCPPESSARASPGAS